MEYAEVQKIAKETITYIKTVIKPGMNLREVRSLCEEKMLSCGADSFWYYDIGAFVFAGDETTISVSGKEYIISDRCIAENDIITIDLSPQKDKIWGDYARTVVIEEGQVVLQAEQIQNEEWRNGLLMEKQLHRELLDFATPHTSFEELYQHMNRFITENGFINLDFMGNLGHSIVKEKSDRIYIEKGNQTLLSAVGYFTFEPHISMPGSKYGYKKENIYFFSDGKIKEL
ncbi:MAG: aminopeptidase P family protein [Lachnospiraceae bacterium]|nr:aminopeptidase P family protein [Lachnospiraceae bacterium]